MTVEAYLGKNTLRPFTNGDFSRPSIDNELASQGASAATVCWVSYHQWPDLFTIISTPRKFAECLYCAVSPPPILHVLSCSIESPVICSLYCRLSHVHTFMHSCIHTSILLYSHIQACTTRTYTHINSHMIASVAQSLVWSYLTNSVINRSKWQVLHNGQLEVYLSFFQVASPT